MLVVGPVQQGDDHDRAQGDGARGAGERELQPVGERRLGVLGDRRPEPRREGQRRARLLGELRDIPSTSSPLR